jgi:hypothetical protein
MTTPAPPLRAALLAALTLLLACGGGQKRDTTTIDGRTVVPIDPNRPGDALFAEGLALYQQAETEQRAAYAARAAGDAASATAQLTASAADYGLAIAKFDQLRTDVALCPDVSIRCDNAAYLAGRSSYETGMIDGDLSAIAGGDAALDAASQAALLAAQSRLDGMLADFPASALVDSAAYFDGRAHYELTLRFGVGTYADAELLFERSHAAAAAGTWSDNALYYDGRCEFELGAAIVAPGVSTLTLADYDLARSLLDQAIAAEGLLLSRFATSSYRDNAAYYQGRAWFEKPTPDVAPGAPAGTSDAERIANLGQAVGALGGVVATPGSSYVPGARYWRGRAHYALWFHQAGTVVNTELDLALADFHAVPATSTWRDNALSYAVKSDLHAFAPAAAHADYCDLATNHPTSPYVATAAALLGAYVDAGGSAAPISTTCP